MAYKVLIIEDDPMVSMINEQYVRKDKDFIVVNSFRNGQSAIEFLEKNQINLVILDVFMPYMDGIETLKKIREKKFDVEVIMVTAANDTKTLEETMHLGVLDYLIKPFAFERLQIALEKFKAKKSTLNEKTVLDQSSIDKLMNSYKKEAKIYPKGIQETTLKRILEFFDKNSDWNTTDFIAENLNISIVTARHYLSYLVQENKIKEDINYSTGGRPCMLYRKKSGG